MKIRRIYRLLNHKQLFAFGDPIGEVPILDKTLSQWQAAIVAKAGLELVDVDAEASIPDEQYLLFENNLYFTYEFIKKALQFTRQADFSMQFGVEINRFNRRFSFPNTKGEEQFRPYSFFFKIKGQTNPRPVIIPQKIYPMALRLPRQLSRSGELDYDQCDTYITAILSPFHLLVANVYAFAGYRFVKYRRMLPDAWQSKIHDRSPLFFRFLKMTNKIGKRCKIHPSAVVEGCFLGDDVIIGANAVVRLSHIGSGCIIEDQATVIYSVLGALTCISHGNLIVASMCYPEVYLIHGPYQFSIYGQNAAVFATINCDFRLDQKTISIPTANGIIDSGQPFLGIAVGHRSKVGGGNTVAPGRIVPNNYWISPPDFMVSKFPEEMNANTNKAEIDWY